MAVAARARTGPRPTPTACVGQQPTSTACLRQRRTLTACVRLRPTLTASLERGFTLIECAVVCAVLCVLASVALPSFRGSGLRMARLDAVQALTRVQWAQEQYRAATGLYAADLAVLRLAPHSAQGRYALSLLANGPDGYRATASAVGTQAQDSGCAALTLDVAHGFAQTGPSAPCWNR